MKCIWRLLPVCLVIGLTATAQDGPLKTSKPAKRPNSSSSLEREFLRRLKVIEKGQAKPKAAADPKVEENSGKSRTAGDLGQSDKSAVHVFDLCQSIRQSKHPRVRFHAAWSLGNCKNPNDAVLKALKQAATDEKATVRGAAAQSLGKCYAGQKQGLILLKPLLLDKESLVREDAVSALENFGPLAVPALNQALGDQNSYVRRRALEVLIKFKTKGKGALDSVIERLSDRRLGNQILAVQWIGMLGKDAIPAIPALKACAQSPHLAVRIEAQTALKTIGSLD
jgi:hypothetical protein